MLINKLIEARIDIDNIESFYCENYNKMIINYLKNKYLNKCFKSVFIIDILQILNRSKIKCKNKTSDGNLYVDVLFEVKGLIFEKGEIIHNCKILQINENNIIIAKAENASLKIRNNTNVNIFKVDQKIPVIVNMQRYNLFMGEVSISAVPLQPIAKQVIFYKCDESNPNQNISSFIKKQMENINDLEKRVNKLKTSNKKIYQFFKDMIYPYKKYKDIEKQKGVKSFTINNKNITDLQKISSSGYLFRPETQIDDNKFYYISEEFFDNISSTGVLVHLSLPGIISFIVNDYHKNLIKLEGFLINYDTVAKIKDNKNIWKMYNMLKN